MWENFYQFKKKNEKEIPYAEIKAWIDRNYSDFAPANLSVEKHWGRSKQAVMDENVTSDVELDSLDIQKTPKELIDAWIWESSV